MWKTFPGYDVVMHLENWASGLVSLCCRCYTHQGTKQEVLDYGKLAEYLEVEHVQ